MAIAIAPPPPESSRVPPHDLEAERSVLGAVLIKPLAIGEVRAAVEEDDFFLPAHREIYAAMLAVERAARALDVVGLVDELRARAMLARIDGGAAYLLTLTNSVPTAENVAHYAKIVRRHAIGRRLIALTAATQARAYACEDAEELLAEHKAGLVRLEADRRSTAVRLGAALPGVLNRIEQKALKPTQHGVPVGIAEFERTIGRLREQQQIVVAARPGGGKSSFALNCALRAAILGVPVLFFSLEMSLQEICERALSFASEVTNHRMVVGNLDGPAWIQVETAAKALTPVPIDFQTEAERIEEIVGELTAWRYKHFSDARFDPLDREQKAEPPLALGVIDYLQLARGSRRDGRATEVADMSRELKRTAKRLRMPLIVVSQLNRDVEKGTGETPRRPKLSDLKESGAIEQDADMVIFPWDETRTVMEGKRKLVEHDHQLIVAKHRNGPTGTIHVNFARERMTYYDATPSEDEDPRFA